MMLDVVGISAISGTSSKNGKPYDSYILYCSRGQASHCDAGIETKEVFIAKKMLTDLVAKVGDYTKLVGHTLDIGYDDRRFVDSVTIVK